MKLINLVEQLVEGELLKGSVNNSRFRDLDITGISTNTATLLAGEMFLATQGVTVDRHDFLADAIAKGARAAIVSKDVPAELNDRIPIIKVPNVNRIVDKLFQRFYGNPQEKLKCLTVTGTDGKTTTATIIWQLLGKDETINIGTNGILFGDQRVASFNTTPDSPEIYPLLDKFQSQGARNLVMEFSSEAQHYNRLQDLKFDTIGLTNITSEHLNTHGSIENYIAAKVEIFKQHLRPKGFAVLNADDANYSKVEAILRTESISIFKYGRANDCNLQIVSYKLGIDGTEIDFRLNLPELSISEQKFSVKSPLLGDFNVENLACALLMLVANKFPLEALLQNIHLLQISGRMSMINQGQDFSVMVDYAHTPNGISRLLDFVALIPQVQRRITVIGQAGERDYTKRSAVGALVANGSDLCVFTEEDPKNEPPEQAIADIVKDLNKEQHSWVEIPDRKKAVEYAINAARPGDLVMILGKGAEDFMKVGNTKVHYSDVEEAMRALKQRLGGENE